MKFSYISILFLGMLSLGTIALCYSNKSISSVYQVEEKTNDFMLTVERGAFHYDSFILTNDSLHYVPKASSDHPNTHYNTTSKKALATRITSEFIAEIIKDGFRNLEESYENETSCISGLKITLENDKQIKTVTCDDFERNCPELMKYIEQKIVDLEGNGLVRLYLPG